MSPAATKTTMTKHSLEDNESWTLHLERQEEQHQQQQHQNQQGVRRLRHNHHHNHNHRHHDHHKNNINNDDAILLEEQKERDFWTWHRNQEKKHDKSQQDAQHQSLLQSVYQNPGIGRTTTHGIMLDAGSTGSRLHVYEWEPRILSDPETISQAVSGERLSFPGTESRWTDRLRPGLADFASISNDTELDQALTDYFQPLLDFAVSVLHTKRDDFGSFPIYLRATAGMRILDAPSRARVLQAVRRVLRIQSPFLLASDEQVRTLSGEEEAIYDWAGVNFLLGDLLQQSEGAGTVANPRLTHGALDLGGGSTQISFFEPQQDIMSNLFKLQIGQAKHWNVYAHSFLFYGMNEAIHRHGARLAAGKSSKERIVQGIYDPCLPKGATQDIRTDIHMTHEGDHQNGTTLTETWDYHNASYPSGNGYYQATLYNNGTETTTEAAGTTEVQACMALAKDLLHLEKNDWCNFAHKGDCSLAGVYQPRLPDRSSQAFGEFVAFSNYHHVWKFLQLPERATIQELYDATLVACAKDMPTLHHEYSHHQYHKMDPNDLPSYCFRSAYVFNLLHHGFGFQMQDRIRVSSVINGQKVGWALGAMLYEINALPWTYEQPELGGGGGGSEISVVAIFMSVVGVLVLLAVWGVFALQRRRHALYQAQYEPVKDHDHTF